MNARIRVAIFIDSLRAGAGTENQLLGFLRHVSAERFDINVFTLSSDGLEGLPASLHCKLQNLSVPKLLSCNGVRHFLRIAQLLRSGRYDVLLTFFTHANAFVIPACLFVPTLVCIVNRRDMGYWHTPNLLRLLRVINLRTDYFLANARAVRSHIARTERFPFNRIKVIPNALWDFTPQTPDPARRSQLGLPCNSRLIGMVANLRPVKRIDRFLALAELVATRQPDAHFVLFGDGPLRRQIQEHICGSVLEGRLHLAGLVPNTQDYLPFLDVGLLTSDSEGLSNALIEYAAAGVPAVAFDVGGNSEVVADSRTGFLIQDGDVSSMADSVHTLLTDSKLRARMSRAARELAMCRFSASTVQRELEDFLEAASTAPRRSLTFA